MAVKYKVWIQVERVDEDAPTDEERYQNISEPDILFESEDRTLAQGVLSKVRSLATFLVELEP